MGFYEGQRTKKLKKNLNPAVGKVYGRCGPVLHNNRGSLNLPELIKWQNFEGFHLV
jgi:hypothetical protein